MTREGIPHFGSLVSNRFVAMLCCANVDVSATASVTPSVTASVTPSASLTVTASVTASATACVTHDCAGGRQREAGEALVLSVTASVTVSVTCVCDSRLRWRSSAGGRRSVRAVCDCVCDCVCDLRL